MVKRLYYRCAKPAARLPELQRQRGKGEGKKAHIQLKRNPVTYVQLEAFAEADACALQHGFLTAQDLGGSTVADCHVKPSDTTTHNNNV